MNVGLIYLHRSDFHRTERADHFQSSGDDDSSVLVGHFAPFFFANVGFYTVKLKSEPIIVQYGHFYKFSFTFA